MSKHEERARKVAEWLTHLQGWKDPGQSLSAYAKVHGLPLWTIYHWRSVLMREGRWLEHPQAANRSGARGSTVPMSFARIAVTDSPRPMSLIVRVVLGNGRRAEIELSELERLGELLGVLEQRA